MTIFRLILVALGLALLISRGGGPRARMQPPSPARALQDDVKEFQWEIGVGPRPRPETR